MTFPTLEWEGPDSDGDYIVHLRGVENWHLLNHADTPLKALIGLAEQIYVVADMDRPSPVELREQVAVLKAALHRAHHATLTQAAASIPPSSLKTNWGAVAVWLEEQARKSLDLSDDTLCERLVASGFIVEETIRHLQLELEKAQEQIAELERRNENLRDSL